MQLANHAIQDTAGTTHGVAGAAHDAAGAGINQAGGVLQEVEVRPHLSRETRVCCFLQTLARATTSPTVGRDRVRGSGVEPTDALIPTG
ncbi:hypothetical protein ACQJBY_031295 [Aegilops geniculata]